MKLSLNQQIFLAAIFGIMLGVLVQKVLPGTAAAYWIIYTAELFGAVFIGLLKMILMPLIFISIAVGIANLKAHAQMAQVWRYTLGYFLTTTSLAIFLGLCAVNLFKPGLGLSLALFEHTLPQVDVAQLTIPEFFKSFMAGLFTNPVTAMNDGNVLSAVVFALFVGIALIAGGEKTRRIHDFLNEFFEIIMIIVGWIMALAPLGILGLLTKLVASQDTSLFSALGKFMAVVFGSILFHSVIVLPALLYFVTRMSPVRFFGAMREALVTAFSTSSSSATLPVSIRCVEDHLGVNRNIAGFVMPLGATINMDGTALYEAVAALFVANLVGIDLSLGQQLIVFLTAMLASIGAPGIPSAGMVTMVMVLQSVGLPAEAIAILLPIDRLLDTMRTLVNVQGDATGSVIVQHLVSFHSRRENQLDN